MLSKKAMPLLVTFVIVMVFVKGGMAQPPQDLEKQVAYLNERLDLTEEQTVQIRDIIGRGQTERDRLRELNEENREAMRAAMQDLRDETDQQIDSLLTEEQKTEYDKMKKEMRDKRHHRGPRDGHRREHR
jgi:Spy/CpxP family protein refolding chaperone